MGVRLRAPVRAVTGKTRHYLGTMVDGLPAKVRQFPTPVWVEIVEDPSGVFLEYFDAHGLLMTDTWHQSVDEAKDQAAFEFEIGPDEWQPV